MRDMTLGSDEYFAHGSRSIAAVRSAIQRILIQATPREIPKLYQRFADQLCPNDVVLTFNYDTLLEQALDDIGKPYSLTPEWWLTDASGFQPKFVDVLKLHGSIDWYDRHYLDAAMRWHSEQGQDVPNRDPIFGLSPSVPSEPLSRGQTNVEFGNHILPRVFRVPEHREHFPIEGRVVSSIVPFMLPPAYDKLLGNDPILDLWENLHRTQDAYSSIVVIGYSMPSHDSYAYEMLGRLLVKYQQGGDATYWEHRRVPIQLVTLADSEQDALKCAPFLDPAKTRVWSRGFQTDCLDWIDWGDGVDNPVVS
ncbi:MAG: SIR2 family protein [Gemmatimonadota bacterium]|nr:SIR2 family protein [Gemmatimonadota bacterium]